MIGLGIDAGGSATRWVAQDDRGAVVASGELEPVTGHLFIDDERRRFVTAMARLRQRVEACGRPAGVVAGITGLTRNTPEAVDAAAVIAETFGIAGRCVVVEDDMWIAYRAVFAPGAGYVVSSGTGSVGYHLRTDGEAIRVGGRGMLIDDAGSAFWIALQGLRLVLRRMDADPVGGGRGRLADALFAEIGGGSWPAVRSFVYGGGRGEVASLARAVARAAQDGDADAQAILRAAGQELARLATALSLREGPKPIALIGRVPALHPAILEGFRAAAPEATVHPAQPDAAAAAAGLALAVRAEGFSAPR